MKRTIKKTLAFLMSFVMIFTLALPAFAEGNGDEIVAEISVCSRVKEVPSLGHLWIYINNISDRELQVGAYTLPAGEGVSVGTLSYSRDDGHGIYYNVEAHCINKYDDHDFYSITRELSADKLDDINEIIINHNHWNIFTNCMSFSFKVWKEATGQGFANMLFPAFGEMQLRIAGAKYKQLKMYYPTADRVYRQSGSGEGATIYTVKDSSLVTHVG